MKKSAPSAKWFMSTVFLYIETIRQLDVYHLALVWIKVFNQTLQRPRPWEKKGADQLDAGAFELLALNNRFNMFVKHQCQ
jgi:hypothetical protein